MHTYFEICQKIYCDFKAGTLKIDPSIGSFDLQYVPDPFLVFGDMAAFQAKPCDFLHVVTTNPGQGIEEQLVGSPFLSSQSIFKTAETLYNHYRMTFGKDGRHHLRNAGRRIEKIDKLAKMAGYGGAVQVELIPWHRHNFPNKERFIQLWDNCNLTRAYRDALKDYLLDKNVVALDAVGAIHDKHPPFTLSTWLTWKSRFIGVDLDHAQRVDIVTSGAGNASGILLKSENRSLCKALFGMRGTNNLPSDKCKYREVESGLARLADKLRPAVSQHV